MFTFPTTMSNDGAVVPITAASWVGIATDVNGGGDNTINITLPGGLVAGDLLILYWLGDGGTVGQLQTPLGNGFSLTYNLPVTLGGTQSYVQVAYKYHSGSEPGSYVFNLQGGGDVGVALFHAWRGAHASSWFDNFTGNTATGANLHTTPTGLTNNDQTVAVDIYFFNGQGTGTLGVSAYPPNTNGIGNVNASTVGRGDILIASVYEATPGPAGTAIGGKTIGLDNNADGHRLLHGIRAAGT